MYVQRPFIAVRLKCLATSRTRSSGGTPRPDDAGAESRSSDEGGALRRETPDAFASSLARNASPSSTSIASICVAGTIAGECISKESGTIAALRTTARALGALGSHPSRPSSARSNRDTSRDGFTAGAGATRARMMWAAGDAAGAREALLRNGAIEAAVGLACREGMDVKARLAASAFVREAMADARGVDAARRMRETLERCARDGRAKTGWFGKRRWPSCER
ncbi:hypothetical protein BE221DRAFT_67028 [Ostreococcus tauri]|uniref:Uncharacterized protein n=1 Tax=Ostreococcus tauri TaxID=70448 RepID=A0A1Y5IPL3_OSTTA|nr:hypothetical protein BE221DRAFT_67028 [Ostreococcus tauri]